MMSRRLRSFGRGLVALVAALVLLLQAVPRPVAADGGDLTWPLPTGPSSFKGELESDFGFRAVSNGTKYHFGIDVAKGKGVDVNAVADGEVTFAGCNNPIRSVVVYHESLGIATLYMHLSDTSVSVGDQVTAGQKVGEVGPDNTNTYGYHLDMRVVKGRLPAGWSVTKDKNGNVTGYSCPVGAASQYDNAARWFRRLDTGAPTQVDPMMVREGTSGGYKAATSLYKTDSQGNQYVEIDEQDIWVRLKVHNDDKDMDSVVAALQLNGGGEVELHKFDYYAGNASTNTTMPLRIQSSANTASDEGYVNNHGTSTGAPAQDIFYAKVGRNDVPSDGKIHKVIFHVKDAFGNEVDLSKTEVPVKRKATYKVDVKPDQEEYTCCAAPTFTVEVRDSKAEGNPLVDIDDEKEKIEAKFMGKEATLSRTGVGTYRATTSEQMRDAGAYPLTVEIKRKSDGKNLGTGAGSAKAKRPPQEYYTDRCGRRRPKVWNPKTCQWEIPPGNQPCQPDDNESMLSGGLYGVDGPSGARLAVLEGGFASTLVEMLEQAGLEADLVPQDFAPTMVSQYRALFVASGGFAGLGQSAVMAERLARYTEAGGTLVVFTQPQGSQFGLLPGGQIEGYGYDEDLFCVYRSAGISTFGPQLMGQQEDLLSINIDGFFTRVPNQATVLLRRTLTGMPAMFTYNHGQGRVLATTSYADMAAQLGQGTVDEVRLVRDLGIWALDPTANPPRTGLGGTVQVPVTLENNGPVEAVEAIFELIGPDGGGYGIWAEQVAVPAGARQNLTIPVDIPFGFDSGMVPENGLWRVQVGLFDAEGHQLADLPAAGLYGVTAFEETPGGFRYQGQPYAMTVTSESEEYLRGEPANFTFHVFNYSDREESFRVTWGLPHHNLGWYDGVQQNVTVPAQSQESFTWQLPAVRDLDRLRGQLHLNGRVVASVERGFWMAEPRVSATLAPTKREYAANESPALTLSLMNLISRAFEAAGALEIRDASGRTVGSYPVQASLASRGATQVAVPLPEPLPYGQYTAVARLTAQGGANLSVPYAAFSVPVPKAAVTAVTPASLTDHVPLTLHIANTGTVAAPGLTATATLTAPDGTVESTASQSLSLGLSEAQDLTFQLNRGALQLGTYKLNWQVTAGNHVVASQETALPAALQAVLTWDKASYRVRETARATAVIRNTGVWAAAAETRLEVADAQFHAAQSYSVNPAETATLTWAVPLPDTLPAGGHAAMLDLGLGKPVAGAPALTVPPSDVAVAVPDTAIAPDEPLTFLIRNTGGVDALASYSATLTDRRGVTIAQLAGEQTVQAGAEASLTLPIPPGAADGEYLLRVEGENRSLNRPFFYGGAITVDGLLAELRVTTDRPAYLRDQAVSVEGDVTVNKGALSGGTLHLAIYGLGGGTLEPCEPPVTPSMAARAAEPTETVDPEKEALLQQYLQRSQEGSARLMAAPGEGWVGPGEPVYNPWISVYDHVYDEYMDVVAEPYGGRFSTATLSGDPDSALDDYKRLLYGHPYPGTSYTTIRIDGMDYTFGDYSGQWVEPIHFDPAVAGLTGTWAVGDVQVRQILTLVPTATSRSVMRIQYQVANAGQEPHAVGLRVMLDTQLGFNDGAPFRILEHGAVTTETEFTGDGVPYSFLAVDSLQSPQVVSTGVVRTTGERAPDRLIFANWGRLYRTLWDFQVTAGYPVTGDSGVAYYWNPTTLEPGQSLDLNTRYGYTKVSFSGGQLSTVVNAPDRICSPAENPFWVQAFVRNNTASTAQAATATLHLPTGLAMAEGEAARQLGDLRPGAETQVGWLVRATGETTGTLALEIETQSQSLSGSTAAHQLYVSPSVFSGGGEEQLLWQTELPVNTAGAWPFSALARTFPPGKYRAEGTLLSPTGQWLAAKRSFFFVAADQTLLTMETDKTVYRTGENVAITGAVRNLTGVAGDFRLTVQAGGVTLLDESLWLEPDQEHPYAVTTTATAEGRLELGAAARDANLAQAVTVALPQVEHSVSAPEVAGREPFPVAVSLRNTGILPATVTVAVDGTLRSHTLEPGAQITDTRSLTISEDGAVAVAVRGDLIADEVLQVRQGQRFTFALEPAATYIEGPVPIGYRLTATGELVTTVPVRLTVDSQSNQESVTLLPGESQTGQATFALTEGEHLVTWQAGWESGQATITVRRPVFNQVAMQATLPERIPGNAAMPVQLQNLGENRVSGRVYVRTPWNEWALPFDLQPDGRTELTFTLDSTGAAGPGTYPIIVEAVAAGQPLARQEGTVTLTESFTLAVEAPEAAGVGAEATFTVAVTNDGDLPGSPLVTLDLPGIVRKQALVDVAPGTTVPVSFTAAIPPDLATIVARGTARAAAATADFSFRIQGYEGAAQASLDKPFYRPNETALLRVDTQTVAPAGGNEAMMLRVSGTELDETRIFPAGTSPSFTFYIPAGESEKVLSYGLYLESGRSVYLNTIRLRTGSGAASLYTDKAVYRPGETVHATLVATRAGLLRLEAPGYQTAQPVVAGETPFTFILPPDLQRGSYEIQYGLDGDVQRYPFEVNAPGVAIRHVTLQTENGLGARLETEATEPFDGITLAWWVTDPSGRTLAAGDLPVNLPAGSSTVLLSVPPLIGAGVGTHTLHYQLLRGNQSLAQGNERFDYDGNLLLGISPRQSRYRAGQPVLVDAALSGQGAALLTLYVDGAEAARSQVYLNGYQVVTLEATSLPAGDYTLTATLTGPGAGGHGEATVRVLPLPEVSIQVSGDQTYDVWYLGDPSVRLEASEPGVPIYYRWDEGPVTRYYGQVIMAPTDGRHTLYAYAEADGQMGPVAGRSIAMDRTPPTITLTEPAATGYEHHLLLPVRYTLADAHTETLADSLRVTLNGEAIDPTVPIDLFWLELGDHTLKVTVLDGAGNLGTAEVTFRVIATIASTRDHLYRMERMGWITSNKLHSLEVKLNAAEAALMRGQPYVAVNDLQAFIHEAEAQTGKALNAEAAAHLIEDARWIIDSLQ